VPFCNRDTLQRCKGGVTRFSVHSPHSPLEPTRNRQNAAFVRPAFILRKMSDDERTHVRFGTRVNSRASIVIRWVEHGRPATLEARTIDISASGCFVVASQPILVGQRVLLTNLANGNKCEARVVRHGQQIGSSWELGIQLEKPSDEFWGLDF
jgi:hypothetical protein